MKSIIYCAHGKKTTTTFSKTHTYTKMEGAYNFASLRKKNDLNYGTKTSENFFAVSQKGLSSPNLRFTQE